MLVLKVLEVFVLEVLTYSTPSKDCVHCEIPPILCGDLTFVLELCDWAVTSTLLLLVLFTFWKVSLKIQKISIVNCDSNWGCVRNTSSAYNPQHRLRQYSDKRFCVGLWIFGKFVFFSIVQSKSEVHSKLLYCVHCYLIEHWFVRRQRQ